MLSIYTQWRWPFPLHCSSALGAIQLQGLLVGLCLLLLLLLSHVSRVRLCVTPQTAAHSSPPGSRPWDSPGKNTGVGCHFLLQCMKVKSESEVAQSCPIDCLLPGSSVHGIFQARVLEWGAIAFSMTNLGSILKSRDITLPT